MIKQSNVRGASIVNGGALLRGAAARRSRRLGLSVAAAMLAGTAIVPASAQTFDLNGSTRTTTDFLTFSTVPPTVFVTQPTLITNSAVGASTLVVNNAGALSFGGNIQNGTGSVALRKVTGTGTLTLSGNNTYSGATTISAGTLRAGSATALSANSGFSLNVAGAGLDLNGFNSTIGSLVGATDTIVSSASAAVLTLNTSGLALFSGALQGNLGLVMAGTGLQVFTNTSLTNLTSNTGSITLSAGQVNIGSDNALGSGLITVTANAALGSATNNVERLLSNNIVINSGATLNISLATGRDIRLTGLISGDGTFRRTGTNSTLTLTGANTYTGGTLLAGGRTALGNAQALSTGAIETLSGSTSILAIANPASSLTLANNIVLGSSIVLEAPNAGQTFTLSGDISGPREVRLVGGGPGTVLLTGNNSFTGLLLVTNGTAGLGSANAVGGSQGIALGPVSGGIAFYADGINVASPVSSQNGQGVVSVGIDTRGFNATLSNYVGDRDTVGGQTLGLTKNGAGVLTLSYTNPTPALVSTLSGGLSVQGGAVNLTGQLNGNIGVGSGATLGGTGTQESGTTTVDNGGILSPGNALTGGVGTLTLNNLSLAGNANLNFTLGAPAGPNDLVVVKGNLISGGLLNFSIVSGFAAATYDLIQYNVGLGFTGPLPTINSGLPVGYNYSVVDTGTAIALQVLLTDLYWDGAGPANNGVVNGGSGTWSAAGTNWTDSTGNVVSTWQPNGNAFFTAPSGTVTVEGPLTYKSLNFSTDGYVINGDGVAGTQLTGDATTINVTGGNTATINVDLAGTNGVTKTGGGVAVLGGNNSFTGGLSINGGTLAVTTPGALGVDAVTVNGGAQTLRFDNSMTVGNNINGVGGGYNIDTNGNDVVLTGSLSGGGADKEGAGILTLTNASNAQPGVLIVNGGTLNVLGAVQGAVYANSGARLTGTGSIEGVVAGLPFGTISPGDALATAPAVGTLTVQDYIGFFQSTLDFNLDVINTVGGTNDLLVVTSNAVGTGLFALGATLNVIAGPNFNIGTGDYRIINYGNLGSTLNLVLGGAAATPPADVTYTLGATTAVNGGSGFVNLNVAYGGEFNWDGAGPPIDGVIQGGGGTWNAAATNWTNSDGFFNLAYVDSFTQVVNFGGTLGGGAVGVSGTRQFGTLNFTQNNYVLSGSGNLAINNGIINVSGSNVASIGVAINGTNGLTKNGTGELVLSGSNGYTGGTTLNQGSITVTNANSLSGGTLTASDGTTLYNGTFINQGAVTIANAIQTNGALSINNRGTFLTFIIDGSNATDGNDLTLGGIISGGGSLVLTGNGRTYLNGANTYTGGTTISSAAAYVGTDTAFGTGDVSIGYGGVGNTSGALRTLANNIVMTAAETPVVFFGTDDVTLNGVVSGSGFLAKTGTNTLTLNGVNTHDAATYLIGGTIVVGNNSALGTSTLNVQTFGSSTLRPGTNNLNTANNIALVNVYGPTNLTVDTDAFNYTLSGTINGTGAITKVDTGRLIVTGNNSYSGGTFLNEGTIQISNGNALGNSASTLTANAGTTLIAGLAINTAPMTLAQNIVLNGGGNLTIDLLGNAYGVNVTTGALLTNGTALTLGGTISGDGGISTLGFLTPGGGSIRFNGENTFAGGVELGSVIAYIGNNSALGTGKVNLNEFGAGIQNDNSGTTYTLGNDIGVLGTQNSVGGVGNLVLTGAVNGGAELYKVGTGTVTFTNANSDFSGSLIVNKGSVLVNGGFTNAGATMLVTGGATLGGSGSFGGSVTLENGAFLSPGNSPGTLTLGNLTLSALTNVNFELGRANTLGGAFNDRVIVTGNLVLDGLLNVSESVGGTFGLGIYNLFSYGSLTNNGLIINGVLPNGLTGSVQINSSAQQVNLVVAGPDSIVLNWDGTDFTALAPSGAPGAQGGSGTWNATNTNWTGEAPGEINATWQNNAVGIFGTTGGTVTVNGSFGFAGLGFQADGYTLNGGTLNLNPTTGSFISVDSGLTATVNSTIAGATALTKSGAGNLVLGGTNTNSGGVLLNNGAITVTNNSSLGTGALTAANGTTLFNGTGPSQGTVTLANAITANGVLNIGLQGTGGSISDLGVVSVDGNTLVLNGVVSGAGSLNVSGFGLVRLNGVNSYTGGTTLTFAGAYVGTDSAFGTGVVTTNGALIGNDSGSTRTLANNIVINDGLDIIGPNDLVLNGVLSGVGSLAKKTSSTLALNSTNTYQDGTDLLGGTIVLGAQGAIGTGGLFVSNVGLSTTLRAGINNLNLGNFVGLNSGSNLQVDTQAFNFTMSGQVTGAGALTKIGSGNLNLTNANSYGGGTALNAGSITVFTNTSLGGGALTMQDGTSLIAGANNVNLSNAVVLNGLSTVNTNGNRLRLLGVVSGTGTLVKTGAEYLVLSGTNTYSGGTNLNVGGIIVTNDSALGTGVLTMAGGTELVAGGTSPRTIGNNIVLLGASTINSQALQFNLNGVISGTGSFTKTGSGNLVLNGVNTYQGGTALTAGTITVGTSSALGTGTLTATGGTSLVAGVSGLNVANAVSLLGNLTVDSGTGTFQLSGPISGAGGSITKVNSGNLILSGSNSYTGGTNLNAGAITVTNNNSIGTGTLTAANGTTLFNGTATGAPAVTLANNIQMDGQFFINGLGGLTSANQDGTSTTAGNTLTLNGVISGVGPLNLINGRNFINGANTYTGGTVLTSTIANVGNDAAFGTGAVTVSSSVLGNVSGSLRTLTNNFSVLDNLYVLNGDGITLNGVVSGAGRLVKSGPGTLTLNGVNTYTGGTFFNNGTLVVGTNAALGTGTLQVASGPSTVLRAGAASLNTGNAVDLGAGANLVVDSQTNTYTLSGVISGAGILSKTGTGNLILSGTNTYGGGTLLNQGTITVANNSALGTNRLTMADQTTLNAGGNFTVGNNILLNAPTDGLARIVVNGGLTFTLNGVISSTNSQTLAKAGTGLLILNGANTYSGTTALNAGTIQVGTNTALGTSTLVMADATTLQAGANNLVLANNVVTNGVGTVDTQANTFRLNGIVSGAGSITKIGSGTLILNGVNSYSGGTNLNAGAITLTNNSSIGTGTLTTTGGTALNVGLAPGASITLANAVSLGAGNTNINLLGTSTSFPVSGIVTTDGSTLTLNGNISGAGTLVANTGGILRLNGANSYTGGTTINQQVAVFVGSDTAFGTGNVSLAPSTGVLNDSGATRTLANNFTIGGGSVAFGGANNLVLNGTVTTPSQIAKIGGGSLTLNGVNSIGQTYIGNSEVIVTNNLSLGTGIIRIDNASIAPRLTAGANNLVLTNAVQLDNNVGTRLTVNTAANTLTMSGVFSGTGGLSKVGSGNLILTGANTYQGGTLLDEGTITVGNNTALGTSLLTMANGTTLNAGGNFTVANNILLNAAAGGTGTVNVNSGLDFTLNGVISSTNAQTLAKTGTGRLILNGANTYSGTTALNAGTIQVGNNTALGTSTLVMADATTLQSGANNLVLANNVVTNGVGTVDTQANLFTLNGVVSGAGSINKIGSGTLVLNGVNTYTGGTTHTAGTIRVGTNSALGTGGMVMSAGTILQAGAAGLNTGNTISMLGGATVDVFGNQYTLSGVISGTGPLSVIDSAAVAGDQLTLTGVNSYTGGTIVTGTTLVVSQDANMGNAAGPLTLNTATLRNTASFTTARNVTLGTGGGTFDTVSGTTLTTNGVFSGSSLTKIGAGTLVLNGANTYTGGTALNAGTIQVGSNTALGTGTLAMADATTLVAGANNLALANAITFTGATTINTQANTMTLNGVISGTGSTTKQGTGILTLTAASTYTGATTVAAGTLNVTGSLVSAVTVNSGAALTGTGTVGALNVLAGGTVAPGAPGTTDRATITVTGAATLAGTYNVDVTPNSNDRITAGGALTLGGTLAVAPSGTFTQFNQTFTVASGSSRTGTFGTATGLAGFGIAFAPVVEYTTTQANIRLAPQSLVVLGNQFGGISGNALEVAQAFDRAVAGGYNPQAFFNVYANAQTALPRTLREMSGEQRATERRVALEGTRIVRETALDRLNRGLSSMAGQQEASNGDGSLTFWMRGAGSWGKADTSGAATAFTTEQLGILTGIDWAKDGLTVGGMFNYLTTDVRFTELGGSSRVESVGGSVYAGYRKPGSGIVINGGFSLAGTRTNGARAITLPSFAQSLRGTATGTVYQLFGELAVDMAKSDNLNIEPFARATIARTDMNSLTETGGVAALAAGKQNYEIGVFNAGLRFAGNSGKVGLTGSLAWQGVTGDRDAATLIGIPAVGQNGNIRSVAMDRSAVLVQAGAGVGLSEKIRFSLGYSGLMGKNNRDHGGRATLNVKF